METIRFVPKMKVETADGVGLVKYTKTKAPDYREIESVCVETDGKEAFFAPDSVKVLEEAPTTERQPAPKKTKKVKLDIQMKREDGSFLAKSEFLALMAGEYDRILAEAGEQDFEDIEKVVLAAFAEHQGARFNLQYLQSKVEKARAAETGTDLSVDEWQKLTKRFKAYMSGATGEKDEGKLYGSKKGAGNGHFLWADHKEEAPKA